MQMNASKKLKKSFCESIDAKRKKCTSSSWRLSTSYSPEVMIMCEQSQEMKEVAIISSETASCSTIYEKLQKSEASTVPTYDIVDLLSCDDNDCVNEEQIACRRISSSSDVRINLKSSKSCPDCIECLMQHRSMEEEEIKGEKCQSHLDSGKYGNVFPKGPIDDADRSVSMRKKSISSNVTVSTTGDEDEEPILVDLTNDEVKVAWKQTIVKEYCDIDDRSFETCQAACVETSTSFVTTNGVRESRIMIADSSSKLNQNNPKSSLTTALKDREPCIPVQPNRCLPIRPAPPMPTHTNIALKPRGNISQLKLSRASVLNAEVLAISSHLEQEGITLATEGSKGFDVSNEYINALPVEDRIDEQNRVVSCASSVGRSMMSKRKMLLEKDANQKKEMTKDQKKRRSHEDKPSQTKRVDSDLDKCPNEHSSSVIESIGGLSQEREGSWNEQRCMASTMSSMTSKASQERGKIVPPLRLKKIIREGGVNECESMNISSEDEKEMNYRIVTGATPSPISPSTPMISTLHWNTVCSDLEHNSNVTMSEKSCHESLVRNDDYKLKNRHKRLRQNLWDLQNKVMDLAKKISSLTNIDDSASKHDVTRLRQMMNCYKKRIKDLSKLRTKFLAEKSPLVYNANNDNNVITATIDNNDKDDSYRNSEEGSAYSFPSTSPEPPKLSPLSPNDCQNKSPGEIRNSPPILPRVYSDALSNLKYVERQDLSISTSGSSTSEDSALGMSSVNDTSTESTTNLSWQLCNMNVKSTLPMTSTQSCTSKSPIKNVDMQEMMLSNTMQSVEDNAIKIHQNEKKETAKNLLNKDTNESVKEPTKIEKHSLLSNTTDGSHIQLIKKSIIDSINCNIEASSNIQCGGLYGSSITRPQIQTKYYNPTKISKDNVLITSIMEDSRTTQKINVSSSTNQATILDCLPTTSLSLIQIESSLPASSHQRDISTKSPNVGNSQSKSSQRNEDNHIMTEQFPTFGNWAARMSKNQISKQKSKLQSRANIAASMEGGTIRQASASNKCKATTCLGNNSNRNNTNVNITPQWNTEKWQHQQRQQQQLLQQVATVGATSQTLPVTSALRSTIYSPFTATPFYPTTYGIDPYTAANFGYHSTLYPFDSYSYHSRLHPGPPLTSYHIPVQDPLASSIRPLQMDKQLTSLQDPSRYYTRNVAKYPSPLTAGAFPHATSLNFDRFRTTSTNHNSGTSCLQPLLLPPPPPLPSTTQQTVPRVPISGCATEVDQFGRNRMIPDVLAAAAAAAVVAAASFGRQHTPLPTFNNTGTGALADVADANPARLNSSRSVNHALENLSSNYAQNVDSSKESQFNNEGYQLQNLLIDGLPVIRTENNFREASTLGSNVQAASGTTSSVYKLPVENTSHSQIMKKPSHNDLRDCETPHLGKISRSPNTLSNLKCSNCGLPGSMFKCLGCEVTFYCDEVCQTRHWSVHVEQCPKKMPKLKKVT